LKARRGLICQLSHKPGEQQQNWLHAQWKKKKKEEKEGGCGTGFSFLKGEGVETKQQPHHGSAWLWALKNKSQAKRKRGKEVCVRGWLNPRCAV